MDTSDFKSSKHRNQRIGRFAALLGVMVAAFAGLQLLLMDRGEALPEGLIAEIMTLEGKVMIKRGPDTIAYTPGLKVLAGDSYQTFGEARVVVRYLDDGTRVVLGPDTTLIFNANAGGKTTNLAGGTVEFEIAGQPADAPMRLISYNAEAEVLAAGKYIQRYRDLATDFEVLEGGLAVRRFVDGKTVELGSGDTHICKPDDSGIIAFDPERME